MKLNQLREKIDSVDEQIIDLLAKRFELTSAIGIIKQELNIESFSPEREEQQYKKFKLMAKEKGLPYNIIEQIYRLIINEVIRNHQYIKNKKNNNT